MTRAPNDLVWPPNDLKWPTVTWKHNFFTKSSFGACSMTFLRFFGMLSRLHLLELSFDPPNDLQMTSKWPKWPIMTWKHNSFTNSHLGACNISFHRFFGMVSRLRLSELSLNPPNDLQMTSKWPNWLLLTWKHNFLPILTWGHVICLFLGFLGCWVDCAYQNWVWTPQMTSKWPPNDLTDL